MSVVTTDFLSWSFLLLALKVAFGLGMVIFVHELGHFAVAKWCGVKCEKFYLGFDIYGLKLAKFQRGETEYGIGILPLGGYVKMLGQDDNPARAAEERERSTILPSGGAESLMDHAGVTTEQAATLDPRSYMAKSVPQRMAIISAGVIMNVIFAVFMAAVAYELGVRDEACGVSAVFPGEAAWKANLQPGDRFLEINNSGDRPLRFRNLMTAVAFGNLETGIDFKVKRENVPEPFWVNVRPDPDKNRLRPTIGVLSPLTTKLSENSSTGEGTAAAGADGFKEGDQVVAVDGRPVATYAALLSELSHHPGDKLRFTVKREEPSDAQGGSPVETDVEVPPRPMRTLGLVMKMGRITAVQADSPGEKAGLLAGDFLVSVDGQSPTDPLQLPEELRRRAGQTVTLAISREGPGGQTENLEKQVTLRDPLYSEEPRVPLPGIPVSVPAIGIAYKVLNVVHETDKGSPAAQAQLMQGEQPARVSVFASGDEIVKAQFLAPQEQAAKNAPPAVTDTIEFGAEKPNWPAFMNYLQWVPKGTTVKLTLKDGRTATLAIADAEDWFYVHRDLINLPEVITTKADSLGQALVLGAQQTKDSVLEVYLTLRKIGTQISPFGLGGPVTIAKAAASAASEGLPALLIFLTMLSANLAVLNFLPIPLLDGGHMVFLILEGVLRRPVSERVIVAFHYLGFVFIITLMLFVLGLDFGLISRVH